MRPYTLTSSRNLLRRPLILGVPYQGLVVLSFVVLIFLVVGGNSPTSNFVGLLCALLSFIALKMSNRFLKTGWEETIVYWFEKKALKIKDCQIMRASSKIEVQSPDTLTQLDQVCIKESLKEHLLELAPNQALTLCFEIDPQGARLLGVSAFVKSRTAHNRADLSPYLDKYVYSLYRLPVTTDPLWLSHLIHRSKQSIESNIKILISFRGVNREQVKGWIELARRSNAQIRESIVNVDSQVSFDEASTVLEGISRGDESIVESSLVIVSDKELKLDFGLFFKEKSRELVLASVLGLRSRLHRSHLIKVTTATDFIPNFFDPLESQPSLLSTTKGYPLYFNPKDARLEALHWVVTGASGSGKSFFTGLILRRLIQSQAGLSVLFIDHNRSFKRLITSENSPYLEPQSLEDLKGESNRIFSRLESPNTLCGVELSDLLMEEKKAATHFLLSHIEKFLRQRRSTHPVYIVLDECWNFMRDEPVLVQRAFREFRKLNGAAIAITQSLSDFLTDQSGQSIFQNAPIRILLRQGEDIGRYQGILNLNEVETEKVRTFRQIKGQFSECLIKTPFLSRIGRLQPTPEEYRLLRTDNLRQEQFEMNAKTRRGECVTLH